jgi:hypothetical protein
VAPKEEEEEAPKGEAEQGLRLGLSHRGAGLTRGWGKGVGLRV